MSGLRPWQTGIYTNGDPARGVLKDVVTLNRHLLANGYAVKGGGKIYHGLASEGRNDTWTEWKGLFPSAGQHELNLNGLSKNHFDWGPIDDAASDMGDYKLTDWAIDALHTEPLDKPCSWQLDMSNHTCRGMYHKNTSIASRSNRYSYQPRKRMTWRMFLPLGSAWLIPAAIMRRS